MKDHTYLLEEGRWQVAGSTIDVVGNANVMIGFAVVRHEVDRWIIEGQTNELANVYEIVPLHAGESTTTFRCTHPVFGELRGHLAFFEDVILATWHSTDGHYHATEWLHRLAPDRYENRGALFLDDGHVSSWASALTRV